MRIDNPSGTTALQAGYLVLITALVMYIVMCKRSEAKSARSGYTGALPVEEGFDNVSNELNFLLTDSSGSMSTFNAGNMANQITAQINASMANSYANAMRDSSNALQAANMAIINNINNVKATLADLANKTNNVSTTLSSVSPFVVRTDKTYQLMSFKIKPVPGNSGNCLDSGSNWQRCDWDNAYRRFQFQQTPYSINDWSHH